MLKSLERKINLKKSSEGLRKLFVRAGSKGCVIETVKKAIFAAQNRKNPHDELMGVVWWWRKFSTNPWGQEKFDDQYSASRGKISRLFDGKKEWFLERN